MRYDNPFDMEPLLPSNEAPLERLHDLASAVITKSARLEGYLRSHTRKSVAGLVRSMNGYYSNLIEGHHTTPAEIEAALRSAREGTRPQKERQQLHLAHLQTQELMEESLTTGRYTPTDIPSQRFLSWIHKEFSRRLPESLLVVKHVKMDREYRVIPGALRDFDVNVGHHLPPTNASVPKFLDRFETYYREHVNTTAKSLIAAAAAHHRLVWIHPFGDGNGRVARLFTQAWMAANGAAGGGLWTLSRGLARKNEEYRERLSAADEKRHGDYDGRGYLSEKALSDFCRFVLETSEDQIDFMTQLLDLGELENRIMAHARFEEEKKGLPAGSAILLRDILLRDEVPRGEVARILNVSPRTATSAISELLRKEYVQSDTPKGTLRLAFPGHASAFIFPNLYPAGGKNDQES